MFRCKAKVGPRQIARLDMKEECDVRLYYGQTTDDTNTSTNEPLSPQHAAFSACEWKKVLQICRVAANIQGKQSRTANKGWSSRLGVGRGANNSSPWRTYAVAKHFIRPRIWRTLVNVVMNHGIPYNAGNFLTGLGPVSFSRADGTPRS